MTKALRRSFAFICCTPISLMFISLAMAQNSAPQTETLAVSTPKDNHTRAKLHTELGSMYFQSGNLIIALEELTIAISIDPTYAQAYSTRGLVLYDINEWVSAEKDFQHALSLDETVPQISNNYGCFLCHTWKKKASIEYFQRAIKNTLYQAPEIAYLNAGMRYANLRELGSAEEFVRKSMRFQPASPQGFFQLARISYKRGNFEAAKAYLKKVVNVTKSRPDVVWSYLRVERRFGYEQAASRLAVQLRRKYPESPEYKAYLKGDFE